MTRIRLAVIGVGDVAQRDYLPEFGRLAEKAEIAVMCGRTPERVGRIAEEHRVLRWSTDYHEVVQSDVDAVVNLTPFEEHYAITLAALACGKHVYTEKPIAVTVAEATILRDEARRRGLMLVAAPSVLLFPQVAYVRDVLRAGDLGTIRAARAHALGGVPPWEGYDSDPTPFFRSTAGPLADMAVYPLHTLSGLLGPVNAVAAMSSRARDHFTIEAGPLKGKTVAIETDDEWQLLLRIEGCIATVEANFATVESPAQECELRGDRGVIAFSLLDVSAPVRVFRAGDGGWTDVDVPHARAEGPDHILGVEHLLDCIMEGREAVASAEHAVHVLEVLDAARAAAASGRVVALAADTDAAAVVATGEPA